MSRGLVDSGEDTSRFDDIFSTSLTPWDVGGVTLLVHFDGLPVHDEIARLGSGDFTLEVAMGRVVLKHIDLNKSIILDTLQATESMNNCCGNTYGIFRVNEGIIDSENFNILVFNTVALHVVVSVDRS